MQGEAPRGSCRVTNGELRGSGGAGVMKAKVSGGKTREQEENRLGLDAGGVKRGRQAGGPSNAQKGREGHALKKDKN